MSRKIEKKIIDRTAQQDWGDHFSVATIMERMTSALSIVKPEFRDKVYFEVQTYGYPYDSSTYAGLFMCYKDYETDEEAQKRYEYENRFTKEQEERDRKEFERLSKKFNSLNE